MTDTNNDFDYEKFESAFAFRQIAPETWCFETKCPDTPSSCDTFLLIGESSAIMIDAGMNKLDLKEYILRLGLTDKPIIGVIDTHSHYDHTTRNKCFGRAFMHPSCEEAIRNAAKTRDIDMDYEITYVKEGDIIDLGGRELEIYEIPAHDAGSIAILDKNTRLLFTGDEVESGWAHLNVSSRDSYPGESIVRHTANMRKLQGFSEKYDALCPAHHGSPISKETIDQFIVCGQMLLERVKEECSVLKPEYFEGFKLPALERPQVLCRYKSAHMGYFLSFLKQ